MALQREDVGDRALSGRRIAVTRPAAQARTLVGRLRELGAEAIESPTIRIEDPADPAALRRAVEGLETYDWIVFTSANGVERCWSVLAETASDPRLPPAVRVAAIGPATAEALEERGVRPDVMPGEYVAEAVATAIIAADDLEGRRVLLPRAAGARQVLPERLRAAGAMVDEVIAYESRPDLKGIAVLRERIERDTVDMITFTAASTVRHYVELAGPDMGSARVAVIGPITARAAREAGVRVDVEATEYTVDGLVKAICADFAA